MVTFTRPQYLTAGDNSLTKAAMEGIGSAMPPHIELTGGKFSLVNAGKEIIKVVSGSLDVIVLDANANKSKSYYDPKVAFDPTNPQPPLCWSDNGVAPSTQAREPQNPTCGLCPHNVWGSATGLGDGKTKACKDYKKIAIFTAQEKSTQFLLRIPPNSFSYWNAYCGFLGANGAELWQVLTRISFSNDPKEPMTLRFDVAENNGAVMWVPQSFEAWYRQKLEARTWDYLIGRNDQPIQGALASMATPAVGVERNRTLPPTRPTQQAIEAPGEPVEEAEVVEPAQVAPPAPKPRGRPPKAQQQAPAQNGQDADGPELPAFLKRTSPGMVAEAPAPDAGMGAALDEAFR